MNISEKYTNEEWKIISSLPQSIGGIMASAGFSGLIGSGKEMFASVQGIMSGKKEYADNTLIQSIIPDVTDRSKAMETAKEQREFLMNRIKENNIKSSEQLRDLILGDAKKVIELIEAKESPEDVSQFKKWVLDVAESVANAAKEGGFLGFGGERFSEKEHQLYDKLKNILS